MVPAHLLDTKKRVRTVRLGGHPPTAMRCPYIESVPGETDLLLRNVSTGGLEVYDINNNQITGAAFIGAAGLDWHFAGIATANGAGTSDLVLHKRRGRALRRWTQRRL